MESVTGLTYLKAARLIDATGADPVPDAGLLIEGTTISAVGPAATIPVPAGAAVIDLGSRTLLPGLIDLHTHLTSWAQPWAGPFDAATGYAFEAAANLKLALALGVTTIRDVGSYGDVGIAAKWAVQQRLIPGPRAFVCRNIICMTGGHGSEGESGIARQADGPDDVRKAVREQVKAGADLIKITTNGPLDIPEFTQAELDAAVDEAHNAGRRVACHASILPSVTKVIRAGVDTIEHGCELDEAAIEGMLEQDMVLVPTLLVMDRIIQQWDQFRGNPAFRSIPRRHAGHRKSFELALRGGVKMGAGVDPTSGITSFAEVAAEVALLAEYGLAPMRAVQAATSVAAEALSVQDCLGTLEPGKIADVIAVQGNPLDDIGALARVELVIKDGEVVTSPSTPES